MIQYLKHIDKNLEKKARTRLELIAILRERPLKRYQFVRLAKKLGLSKIETAHLLGVSIHTFHRQASNVRISFQSSEKALKLAEILELGLTTFDGDEDSFIKWLSSEVPALSHHKPKELLTSSIGTELIKEELMRIEHGIY